MNKLKEDDMTLDLETLKKALDDIYALKGNADLIDKHPEPLTLRDEIVAATKGARDVIKEVISLLNKKVSEVTAATTLEEKDL